MDVDSALDAELTNGSAPASVRDRAELTGNEMVGDAPAQPVREPLKAAQTLPAVAGPLTATATATASAIAFSAVDEAAKPMQRPGLQKFLWYCYQGALPPENWTWVLNDVTRRTWVLRHFARWLMIILPILVLILAFLPSPFGIRLFVGIAVSGAIFMFALVNILVDTDRRAVRAGYSFSLPGQIRGSRSIDQQRLANQERRERRAARQGRRGH